MKTFEEKPIFDEIIEVYSGDNKYIGRFQGVNPFFHPNEPDGPHKYVHFNAPSPLPVKITEDTFWKPYTVDNPPNQ